MDVNKSYCDNLLTIDINIDLFCFTLETNIMLYVNYISIKKP